jgi:hypothetical protein
MMRERGFWRYAYKRSYLLHLNLCFFPTFSDAQGFYVLDDWYFLLTFLATRPNLTGSDKTLYLYNNQQRSPLEELSRYNLQIEREYLAFKTLDENLAFKSRFDLRFLIETLYLRTHMIALLLNPSPSKLSKIRLILSLLKIQVKVRMLTVFMLKSLFLLLRVLTQLRLTRVKN